jgi:glycosyltransferase involved in cell wall biosynthesis
VSRLAIVSCLPPDQTGVADFTHRLLTIAGDDVRGYAAPLARLRYIAGDPLDATRWRVGSHRRLDRDAAKDIDAVVIMIGNSSHFAPIAEWAQGCRARIGQIPRLLYLHDVFLLNLFGHLSAGDALMEAVSRDQGRAVRHPGNFDELVRLVDQRALGAAVLIRHLQPDAVIVNSAAARELIAHEPGMPRDIRLEAAFHPVFPTEARWHRNAAPHALRIGTFGLQTPLKQLELVLDAVELLRELEPDATLVIAGYGAKQFVARHGLAERRGIEVHESPDDARLDALMASVDLAVQLRAADLGESSGIVARLLAVGTPIIATARGAALELGEAVTFAGASIGARELAELIRREIGRDADRGESARRYAERHTPRALVAKLTQVARETLRTGSA